MEAGRRYLTEYGERREPAMIHVNRTSAEDRKHMTSYQREADDRRVAEERAALLNLLNYFRGQALQGLLARGVGYIAAVEEANEAARAMLDVADPECGAEQSDEVAALRKAVEVARNADSGKAELIRQVREALGVTDGESLIEAARAAACSLDRTRIALRLPQGVDLPAEAHKIMDELVGYALKKRDRAALPANAIDEAVARERETCAQIANAYTEGYGPGCNIAAVIRARGAAPGT